MVMTHLADVTDRIDRSNSPRGGGEERELDDLSKERAAVCRCLRTVIATFWLLLQPAGHLSFDGTYDAVFRGK